LNAQQVRSRALAVSDDGRQNDGPVDLRPSTLPRCGGRGLEDPLEVGRNKNLARSVGIAAILDTANMRRHLTRKPGQIDVRGSQNDGGIGVLGQRQQQMLQRHRRMLLSIGIARGARQRRSKMLRHGNSPEVLDDHSPEPCFRKPQRGGSAPAARPAARETA
jgi:hypothetical protein